MKTTKPLASISYNSYGFLVGVLERFIKDGFIDFYAFIHHDPEEDEEKEHWHVYIEPCQNLDPVWLRKQFMELDLKHPNLPPLGTLKWGKSKFYDWYWYGIHDREYLAEKGQSRKFHYSSAEVQTNDDLQLMEYIRLNPLKKGELALARDMMLAGCDVLDIMSTCHIKMKEVHFFMQGLQEVAHMSVTDRNGRPNHEPIENNGVIEDGKKD